MYKSHNFIVSLFLAVYTKCAKYKTHGIEILLHGSEKIWQDDDIAAEKVQLI